MKKTRSIVLVLCLLLMVAGLVLLNACVSRNNGEDQTTDTTQQADGGASTDPDTSDTDDGSGCTHSWSEWAVITPATCTEQGKEQRICSQCQKTEDKVVDALGHAWGEWNVVSVPACGAEGVETRICANDATHFETRALDVTGHTFDREVAEPLYLKSAATCTEKAVYYKSCVCGLHETGELAATFTYGPDPSHAFGAWVTVGPETHKRECTCGHSETALHAWDDGKVKTPATHLNYGEMSYTCTDCGAVKAEQIDKIAEHPFTEWSEVDKLIHKRTCVCGAEETAAHTWGKGKVTVAATHLSFGEMSYTCADCGAKKTEVIEKLTEHDYSVSCENHDAEHHKVTCACGQTQYRQHTWNEGTVTVAATCKTEGVKLYVCTECEAEKTETIAKTSHAFGEWDSNADGYERVCASCGHKEISLHQWDEGEVTKAPTCAEKGEIIYTCLGCAKDGCDATKAVALAPSDAHVFGEWKPFNESTHKRACTKCNKEVFASHEWDGGEVTVEPTHTAEGVREHTCTVCGETEDREIAKTPTHSYGDWENYDQAKHVRRCECGFVEYADHAWDDGTVAQAPTHTVAGIRRYTCSVCDATKDETIAKTPEHTFRADDFEYHNETSHVHFCACGEATYEAHAWDSGMTVKDATCSEEGVKTYTCSVCGGTRDEAIVKLPHVYVELKPYENKNGEINDTLHVQICACGQSIQVAHSFDGGKVTKEPGCQNGEKTYTCACGYAKKESIPATGAHRFGAWENTAGGSKHTCQDCGHTEMTAHQWDAGTVSSPATCTTVGEMLFRCTKACGNASCTETYTKPIPVIPHEYGEKKVDGAYLKSAATCQNHATYYYSCACGAVDKGEDADFFEDTEGKLAAHVYDQADPNAEYLKAEATCTSLALYYKSCKCGACDKSASAGYFSYGQKLAHEYEAVTTVPTCEKDGSIVYTCSACQDSYTEVLDATGHNMVHVEQAATCEKDGYSLDYCDNDCGVRTEVVLPAGHSFAVERTEATCNKDGLETKICKECGHKEENVLQKTGAHKYSVAVTVSVQSCTTDGVTSYKCETCGETKKNGDGSDYKEIAPKTGHSEHHKNVVEPTCTAAGYTQSVCSCGYIISVTPGAAAKDHSWKTESEKEATCTQTGERELTCTVCGEHKNEIIEKKTHQVTEATVAATCTANAYKITSCANCDYKVTEEIAGTQTAHQFVKTVIAPTCEAQGYTVNECSVCHAKVTSEIKDPLGHSFNDPTCCADATCQNAGCQAVGQKATGKHSYELTKTETTCEKITKTYECKTKGCTASYTEESKGAGHDTEGQTWTENAETTISKADGCMTVVTKSTACKSCGETVKVVSDSYNSCQYSKQVTKNATCKTTGEVKYTCQNEGCGHSYTENTPVDTEAHAWKDADTQTLDAGTSTKKKVCSDCGASKTVADASNGVTSDDLNNSDELTAGGASIQLPDSVKNEIQNSLGENGKLNVSANPTDVDNENLPENSVVFDLQMSNGTEPITQFGEKIKVRVPYTLSDGEDPDNIAILYLDDNGNIVDTIKAVYVEIDGVGYAEFETDHFSYYTVTRLSPKQRCELYGHVEKTVSQKANCLIDGYEYTLCTRCGHKGEVKVTPATGHDWHDATANATCTKAGYTLTTCHNCQLAYKTEIKALGHEMVVIDSKEATCTTAGYTNYACQREGCNDTHRVEIAKLGHNYGKTEATAPTCTEAGYTTYTCTNCDHSYVADLKDATGHTVIDTVVAPTCNEGGYTAHTCKNCDVRFANTDETAALGHKWDIKAPTCGKGQLCTACGFAGAAATGEHEYGKDGLCKEPTCRVECAHEWYDGDVVPATCDEDGYTKRFCNHCGVQHKGEGYKYYKKVEKLGHHWKDTAHKDATCNEDGYHSSVCTYCSKAHKEEYKKDKSRHELAVEAVAATCTGDGYVRTYCRGCKETIEHTVLKATGHKYKVEKYVDVSCEVDGYELKVCKTCGDKQETKTEKFGHKLVLKRAVAATCVKDGCEYYVCENKGCNYKEETVVEKLAHAFGKLIKHDDEQHKRVCSGCGLIEYTAHAWDKGVETTKPTHLTEGSMLHTCKDCGATKTEAVEKTPEHSFGAWKKHNADQHKRECACGEIDYVKHTYDKGKVTTASTHLTEGVKTYTCKDCGATKTEAIAKDPTHSYGAWEKHNADQHKRKCACGDVKYATHTYDDGKVTKAPTHTETGKKIYTCVVCDATKSETLAKDPNHVFGKWTETATGFIRECICGEKDIAEHKWDKGVVTKAATHTETGIKTYTCTGCALADCKATRTEIIEKDPAHTFGAWEKYNETQHQRKCACGETEVADHAWNDGKVTTEATHTAEGEKTFTCTVCKATRTEKVAKDPKHTFGDWEKLDEKQHQKKCECGETEVADHAWDDGKVTTEATHIAEGEKTFTCTVCKATRTEKIKKDPKHTFGDWESLNEKQHQKKCECGETEVADHAWDDGKITLAPTCKAEGEKTFTCADCGDTYKETIEKTGHSYIDGVCENCGESEPVEGGCDHSDLNSCEIKVNFLTNIQSCEGGAHVMYICPSCHTEVKSEYRFSHQYESKEIDLSEYGAPCKDAILIVDACRFCETGNADVKSNCEFEQTGRGYLDPDTGMHHDVSVYTCCEHGWQYSVDRVHKGRQGCSIVNITTYVFGIKTENEVTMTFAEVHSQHNTTSDTTQNATTDTDENGKVWNAMVQSYKRYCQDCGAIIGYEEGLIRIDENGNPVWAHVIAKRPIAPFDEDCTEFFIEGEMYQIAKYEKNENGEWVFVYLESRESEYNADGTVEGIEVGIEKYDFNGKTTYECGKYYIVVDGKEILVEFAECEYVAVTRNNGTVKYYPSKVTESSYDEKGNLIETYTESWSYKTVEGNNCKLVITHTDSEGNVEVITEVFHGEREESYSFRNGDSCDFGYTVTVTCKDCGEIISQTQRYGHSYKSTEKYDLGEFGHSCGGYVMVDTCTICEQQTIYLKMNGSFMENKEPQKGEDGAEHTVYTTICAECGYCYTREIWRETVNCLSYEYTRYRFGVTEDGSAQLELSAKRAYGSAEHKLEVEVIQDVTSTETDDKGNVLNVHTVEQKEYCTACKKIVSHTVTVTKTDANGNMLYHSTGSYTVDADGNTYVSNRVVNTYSVATLESGEVLVYQTLQLNETLNADGDVTFFKRYDYKYKEGDYCHREVHYSDSNSGNGGDYNVEIQETHGDTERSYSFVAGQNCETGINVNEICTRCGDIVYQETYYHHINEGKTVKLDAKCGLSIYSDFCPCGQNGWWTFENWGCKFECLTEAILGDDGKEIGNFWTYTCKECGFVYTERTWTETSKDDCHTVTYQILRFGIDDEGKAQYEINREIDKGYNHSTKREVLSNSQEFDEETGLTVVTSEARFICENCGKIDSHTKMVTKTDANGNQLYRYQANYAYTDDGEAYVVSDTEYEYVLRTLPSGKSQTFLVKELQNKYDADGTKTYYSSRVNEYADGEFCSYTSTYTDSNGKGYTKQYESHGQVISGCELLEGSTDCKEGWVYRESCVICGKVSYEDIRYGHEMYAVEVDMTQYGAKCGGHVTVFSCACGLENSIEPYGLNCSFSVKGEKVTSESGEVYRIEVYTCNSCGFSYVRDMYDSYGADCTRYSVNEYRFGLDEDGKALYTFSSRKLMGKGHVFEQQTVSSETTTETDESGRELTVTTTVLQEVCKNCGMGNGSDRLQTIEKADEHGNVLYRAEQTYNVKDETPVLCWEYIYAYVAAELEDGKYQTYQTLRAYNSYDYGTGEVVEWWKYEYAYTGNSYCVYTETYSSNWGDNWSNTIYNHQNTTESFVFIGEANSCDRGVLIEVTCAACGEQINRYETYGHLMTEQTFTAEELGAGCGGMLPINECERCDYVTVDAKMLHCSFKTVTDFNEKNEDGTMHRKVTRTCNTCGFVYTEETQDVMEGTCYVYRIRSYRFAIDSENNALVEVTSKQFLRTQHTSEYENTDTVESTEVVDGVTLTVRTWAQKRYCAQCEYVFERYEYVEKINEAGHTVYRLTREYTTQGDVEYVRREYFNAYDANGNSSASGETYFALGANGNTYKTSEYTYEYVAVLRADGTYGVYTTKHVTTYYNADGTVSDGYTEVYVYENGNYCVRTMTRTCYDGRVEGPYTETNHVEYKYVYTLVEGATSCYGGVIVTEICKDCQTQISEHTTYNHDQYVDRYTVSTECGPLTVSIQRCACGFYCYDYISSSNCSMEGHSEQVKDENGVWYTVWTNTCNQCGFTYTTKTWEEITASCERFEHRVYRIGVAEDGSALYEAKISYSHGVQHGSKLTESEPTEETVDGLLVVTTVRTDTCPACGKLHNVFTVVSKYDANGNLVYEGETREDPTLEVEGGLYKARETYNTYGYATLANGNIRRYKIAAFVAEYHVDGSVMYSDLYEYTYPTEGDYCYAVCKYTDTKGTVTETTEYMHENTAQKYVLSEGSVTCTDGVDVVTYCRDCGTEIDRSASWKNSHVINQDVVTETLDLAEYGAVCGGEACVYACACGERKNLTVSANCHFDSERYWYTDPTTGDQRSGTLYTCAVTDPELCGFSYLALNYTASDEKCYGTRYLIYLFGFDRETEDYLGKWESSYATGSISHAFEYTYNEATDEENSTRVVEEVYACKNCGTVNYKFVYTYEIDENGNQYETGVDRYYYNSRDIDSNYLTQWDHYEKLVQRQENGETRTVNLVEQYTYYNENGEITSWSKNEYDYSQSACRPVRTYTDSNGSNDVSSDEINHWWNYSIDEWVNGRQNTCTQDGIRILHCYECDEVYEQYENAYRYHSYDYDSQTGTYRCWRCGLENFTGGDGDVMLEDLTNRWGDGTKYVVGFYNRYFEEYWIALSLVVGEGEEKQYFDLDLEFDQDGTVIYVDAQAVQDAALAYGLNACEYMLEVNFIPSDIYGEYDFAITLDPHVYQRDDENCVIPEDPCNNPYITAYKCALCGDTYKTIEHRGHQDNQTAIHKIGDSGVYLYVYTCRVCQRQSLSRGSNGEQCNFTVQWFDKDIDGVRHEFEVYTCQDCGFVFQYDTYYVPTEKTCERLYTLTFSWAALEDGTFEHSVTVNYKELFHNNCETVIENNVEQGADGSTVQTENYQSACSECGVVHYVRYWKRVTDQYGNVVFNENRYEYANGDISTEKNTYTYFVGPDGGRYLESNKYEYSNMGGSAWGWNTTYSYDFESQIRYYERVDLNAGYIQDSGSEWFPLTGDKDEGDDKQPEEPVDPEQPIEPGQPDQPGQGGTTGGNIAAGDLPDFGGQEITIVQAATDDRDWLGDESSVLSAAVYERNLAIEESLNVELNYVTVSAANATEFLSQLNVMVLSGTDEWDIVSYPNAKASGGAVRGLYADLNDSAFTYLDLDASYWNQNYIDAATVDGKLYSAVSNANLSVYDATNVVYFNETLAADYGVDSPYQTVLNGEWTIEKMAELAQMCSSDLNGDGSVDTFGLVGLSDGAAFGFLRAGGVALTTFDGSDYQYEMTDKFVDLAARVNALWNTAGAYRLASATDLNAAFTSNSALFMTGALNNATVRESDASYGVLPMPKYDMEQADYTSAVYNVHSVFAVPKLVDTTRYEAIGAVLEFAASESEELLYEAYYEYVMGEEINGEEKVDVFEVILETPTWEIVDVYATELQNPVHTLWTNVFRTDSVNTIYSNFEANRRPFGVQLSELINQLTAN